MGVDQGQVEHAGIASLIGAHVLPLADAVKWWRTNRHVATLHDMHLYFILTRAEGRKHVASCAFYLFYLMSIPLRCCSRVLLALSCAA